MQNLDPIRIEQYATVGEDGIDLWEITDLTDDDLKELEQHLALSPLILSEDLADLLSQLRSLVSSLDMPQAS